MLRNTQQWGEGWVFDLDRTLLCTGAAYATPQFLNILLLRLLLLNRDVIQKLTICTHRALCTMEDFFRDFQKNFEHSYKGKEHNFHIEDYLTHAVRDNLSAIAKMSVDVSIPDDFGLLDISLSDPSLDINEIANCLSEGIKILEIFEKSDFVLKECLNFSSPPEEAFADKNLQLLSIALNMAKNTKPGGKQILRFFDDKENILEAALKYANDPDSLWPKNIELVAYRAVNSPHILAKENAHDPLIGKSNRPFIAEMKLTTDRKIVYGEILGFEAVEALYLAQLEKVNESKKEARSTPESVPMETEASSAPQVLAHQESKAASMSQLQAAPRKESSPSAISMFKPKPQESKSESEPSKVTGKRKRGAKDSPKEEVVLSEATKKTCIRPGAGQSPA